MNWYLYIVKEGFFLNDNNTQPYIRPGFGVGKCEMGPGIIDARYGTMYVVPGKYIGSKINLKRRGPDPERWPNFIAEQIKGLILCYYQ